MKRHGWAIYALLVAGTLGTFWIVCHAGAGLVPPSGAVPAAPAPRAPAAAPMLFHILLALALVIVAARAFGALFQRLGQPPVVGEVIAGICLGPSLLGRVAPGAAAFVLPEPIAPYLSAIAQIGVVLYMFLVGLELDGQTLRRKARAAVLVSHSSIVVPFLLGALLALYLYPRYAPPGVGFLIFALFVGVSLSVTAFPVLARILTDRGMHTTPLGMVAVTCAAVDDVTAWCLLALLVSVAKANPTAALRTVILGGAYIAIMLALVRPHIVRWVRSKEAEGLTRPVLSVACVALLVSALATEYVGIHAIFGAFLLGALVPSGSRIARELTERLEDVVVILFLPAYFAFTGMRTQIGLVSGAGAWLVCGFIILVATAGKFGGTAIAARLTGTGWRDSAALGVLMNTRGLMELIVLNLGLDLGVISPTLFAMLVIMALVATFATTPVLRALERGQIRANRRPDRARWEGLPPASVG